MCGDEVKLPDIRVAYMISMVNIIGLFWDGKSFVRKEYTHLFEYLERFMSLDIMSETTCHLWIPPSVNLEKLVISLEKMGMNLRGRSISPGTVPLNATHKYYELAKGFERNKSFGLPAGGGVEQESANNIKEQGEDKNNDSNATKSKAHGTGTPASRAVVVADTSQREQPRDQSSSDFLKSRAPLTPEQCQRASRNFRSLRSRVTAIAAFKKSGRAAKIHGTDDDDDNDTVSGSITFAHRIDEESPLKFITSDAKFQSLEEGDLIFSVAFSAFDSTFHSDIVSSKKYFVRDLGFAKRFGDIMESKDGVNFVNWTKFNTYIEVDAKEAYMNLAKLGRKPARQTIKAAVKTVATVNAVVHAAQGDKSAGGDDDEVSKTESDLSLGTGVSLAPAELSEVKSRPGQAVLFPHVTMTDAGDQLPVCTQTMSIALAMQFCGLRVKMYGVPADGVPKWHAGTECEEGGSDDPFIKRITAELGSAAQPEWSCAGCGDKFGQPLLSRDGVYFRGIVACLEACRKSSADVSRAMSELNASTPHGDWLLEIYGKLNAALLKFVQNGTKGELLQSKADLSSVLGELETHLERYGNGGSGLLTGPKWHLLDCLIAPLVHRCSASLSYFEGSPLPGSAVNEYMALVCTEESWLASVATHDAAEASSSYIESLRLGLGKNASKSSSWPPSMATSLSSCPPPGSVASTSGLRRPCTAQSRVWRQLRRMGLSSPTLAASSPTSSRKRPRAPPTPRT